MTKNLSLQEATQQYLKYLRTQGKSERTLYTYGKDLEQITAFFGPERKISSILLPHVGKFFKSDELLKLSEGKERAFKTVDKTKRVFRMFMLWAFDHGYTDKLPFPKGTPLGRGTHRVPLSP
jgi:site-specific recombinase XerD